MKYIKSLLFGLLLIFSVIGHAADTTTDPYQAAQERAASERAAMVDNFFGWAQSSAFKAMGINFDFSKPMADNLVRLTGVRDAVAGLIDSVSPYESTRDTAKKLITGEDSPALTLFAVLSVLLIAWAGLQMVMGAGWDELMDAVITISFFSLLLFQYDQIFGESLPKMFGSWSDTIYAAATGNSAGGGMSNAAGALVEAIFAITLKALIAMTENMVSYLLLFSGVMLLFTGPAIYKIAMAAITVVSIFLIANGVAAIALAIGPVMVAFGVLPWTRKLFYGWLSVITTALGTKVVLAATLPVFLFFSDQMSHAANFTNGGGFLGGSAIKDTILLMIYAKVLSTLIETVPTIAQGIFGGVMGISMKAVGNGGSTMKDAAATAARVGLKVASKGIL